MTALGPRQLSFVCELDSERLTQLFSDGSVTDDLRALDARVVIMVSDLSQERAAVVRQVNDAGIPLIGIPLFPEDEGYYFTVANADRAQDRYEQWKAWSSAHGLRWDWVGLDIEPDLAVYKQIAGNPWRLPAMLLARLRDRESPRYAREAYAALIQRIRSDGWQAENYQFPLIADERKAGSTFLQRLLGLVDVHTDREVWMLYTSFLRAFGPGLLWSYGPEADAIAVGSTGGGPDIEGHPQVPALSWDEFARDLRLAHRFTNEIYVHSLEGCVWQDFLKPLRTFEWSEAQRPDGARPATAARRVLQAALWSSSHPREAAAALVALLMVLRASRTN